jgi:hypothetical protein
MSDILDLFGDPIPANHGRRGRPAHIPTVGNRHKVSMLLACGWSNERIASALNVDLKTLRKHYVPELKCREVARDRLDATFIMNVWGQAQAGVVGAMRLFAELMEKNDVAVGHASFYYGQRQQDRAAKPERLGKKQLAERDALTAGEDSDWGNDLKPLN